MKTTTATATTAGEGRLVSQWAAQQQSAAHQR
jgi:hypothetical protein